VTALSSLPSNPNNIQIKTQECKNEDDIDSFYSDVPGLKMMFLKGKMWKTNVMLQDNEFEYYRLVGEAYNQNKLDRANLSVD